MKAVIILAILATLAGIFLQYKRSKNLKKTWIALASFGGIVSLAVMGNLTRPVVPIYITHMILVIVAWGGLWMYIIRSRYYWWAIFSPVLTIVLFLILDYFIGSSDHIL